MISTQGKLWCEYPDPVIVAYLDHVQALSGARHAAVNGMETGNALYWLFPVFWWLAAKESILSWAMRRIAVGGCCDEAALREYRVFWARLAHEGWSAAGSARAARGLFALRSRLQLAQAAKDYARAIGAFVPPESIGWDPTQPPA
jgi:hypothetical protein